MCGIAGFAGKGDATVLPRMAEAIRRRGPDDQGVYAASGVGFAFRRLSIIDVAGGHQPLSNEDGTVWVMLNGEIYGFQALREELMAAGHRFVSRSDAEVIVHAYEEWGDDFLKHIDGMFAIAVWDAKRERLLLARDRMGKKPLYWTERDGTFWFASELKALIAAGIKPEIDPAALGSYLRTDSVATPASIFRHVRKLPPATAIVWSNGLVTDRWMFWKPHIVEQPANMNAGEALSGLRERVDSAVHRRLVSDVPLGLFLSGGIDSAVVAESAARQSVAKLKAFTIGFEDASYDERPACRLVASSLGIDLQEETLDEAAMLSVLDDAVQACDEPLNDPAILPQILLARFTKKFATVALTGDGGDELFLGYPHIPAHRIMERMKMMSRFTRHASRFIEKIPAKSGYFSFGFKAQRLARGLSERDFWARDLAWRGAFTRADAETLLVPELLEAAQLSAPEAHLHELSDQVGTPGDTWRGWTWAYLRTYLMDDVLVKVDRATMWEGIEARSPLLDTAVVEYVLGLPSSLKLGAYRNKRLLKELVRGRIPNEVIDRPKHGFGVPVAAWMSAGPLAKRLDAVSEPELLRRQGLFEPSAVARFVSEHRTGRKDRRKELWAFLAFQLWYGAWVHPL